MKKLLFIYNPASGKGQVKSSLHSLVSLFSKAGYLVSAYPTRGTDEDYQVMKKLSPHYNLLVIAGGDGTLHEAVNALMELPAQKRVPVGFLPAGSTNDFAISHIIPLSLTEAAKSIVKGQPVPFDIGAFTSGQKVQYFSYVAGFGTFTDVSYDTPRQTKNALGHLAYILEGAKRLTSYKPLRMKITADGEKLDGDYLLGLVMNTTSVGGFALHGGDISLRDGLSELVLVKAGSAGDMLPIINALIQRSFEAEGIVYRKVSEVTFTSRRPIAYTLDGEFGGEYTTVTASTCPQALSFVVSAPPSPVETN